VGTLKGFIFDRDGIVNKLINETGKLRPPRKISELTINNEIIFFSKHLRAKGYKLFIISNQPDVKRGVLSINDLNKINQKISETIYFDDIICEVHDDVAKKKPSPYMVKQVIKEHNLNISNTWLFGDRWVDILSAKKAGIRSVLLEKDYSFSETSAGKPPKNLKPNISIKDLKGLKSKDFLEKFH